MITIGSVVLENDAACDMVSGKLLCIARDYARKWERALVVPSPYQCCLDAYNLSDAFEKPPPDRKKLRKRQIKDHQLWRADGSFSPEGF